MDARHQVRAGQGQQIVVALEVRRPVLEALAAKVFLAQGRILQHRAHAAIQHQNAVFQAIDEAGCLRGRCCYGHGRVCLQLDACQVDER